MIRNSILFVTVLGLVACAGWDDTKQMKDLTEDERSAICAFQYAAMGGQANNAVCTTVEEGQAAPVLISQGESDAAQDACVADSGGVRWVDCPTADYVACLRSVDEEGDLCVTQTAATCKAWADCVAHGGGGGSRSEVECETDRGCPETEVCNDGTCVPQ